MKIKVIMIRRIMLLILLVINSHMISQEVDSLEILPKGVNGFIVKEFSKKSSEDIYLSVKKWMQYNIRKADAAEESNIKNEYISFKINKLGRIHYKKSKYYWDMDLGVEIRIKENKMRLDIQIIKFSPNPNNGSVKNIKVQGSSMGFILFNKKEEPSKRFKSVRDNINLTLNNFADEIFNSVNGAVDQKMNDW